MTNYSILTSAGRGGVGSNTSGGVSPLALPKIRAGRGGGGGGGGGGGVPLALGQIRGLMMYIWGISGSLVPRPTLT